MRGGWSQEVVAHEIGVHWTHLGQVERGQCSARVESVLKFAAGLCRRSEQHAGQSPAIPAPSQQIPQAARDCKDNGVTLKQGVTL